MMSRVFCGIALSTVFLVFARGQDSTSSATALVEGSVLDTISGGAVKRAHVMSVKIGDSAQQNSPQLYADTDANGHFALHLDPGVYQLWVDRPGYAHQNYGAASPSGSGNTLTLAAGQELRNIDFRITPFGAISGRVVDEDGEPVQGAGIQVLKFSYASGKRTLLPVSGTSSNDHGEFRAYSLPPGRYLLLASQRGDPLPEAIETGTLVADAQQLYAPLFYPGVLDVSGAIQIALTEGQQIQDVDFRLRRVRVVTLRGKLLSPAGNFLNDQVQVLLAPQEGISASYINRSTAIVDRATGRFEFHGVAPGSYCLAASQIHNGRVFTARSSVEVSNSGHPDEISLQLAPPFDLIGEIQFDGGPAEALRGARVTLSDFDNLTVGPQPSAPIAVDGSIRVAGISPGLWEIAVSPLPKGAWIKSVSLGGHDALSHSIDLTAGQPTVVKISIAAKGGKLSGTVLDGDRPHRATVVLIPASNELRSLPFLYATALANDQGKFVLDGIHPGEFKVFAFDEIEPYAWFDPDFVRSIEQSGSEITISETDEVERQFPLLSINLSPNR